MTILRKVEFALVLLLVVVVAGCGPSFTEELKNGERMPPGNVLVVGKIVYRHNGKHTTAVAVRDEYEDAVRELAAMKIAGVKGSAMEKKLAVVVK